MLNTNTLSDSKKKIQKMEFKISDLDDIINVATEYYSKQHIKSIIEDLEKNLQLDQVNILNGINPQYLKLNVGGRVFPTTLDTVRSFAGCKIDKMFTGKLPLVKDDKGNFFIDRNPDYFEYVLELLRDGNIAWPTDSFSKQKIQAELEYFGLTTNKSKNIFDFDPTVKSSSIEISGSKIKKIGNSDCAVVLGDKQLIDGIWKWKVTLVNCAYWGAFGICNKSLMNINSFSYASLPCICTDGNAFMMSPVNVDALSAGDVIEFEYNAETSDFIIVVESKNIKCSTKYSSINPVYPFFILWSNMNEIELTS